VNKLSICGALQLAAAVCAVSLLELTARAAPGSEGSAPVASTRVQEEMKQGAQALRAGKYDEAQAHYRNALELDPSQKTALVFLARSIRAQYKLGIDDDPRNVAKATEAISIYQKALQIDPNQDEAFTAVDELYAALKNEPKQRDWLLKRAESEQIPKGKRSAAYRRLADLDLACTRRMAAAEPAAADRCAASGLESIRRAIALNGDSEALLTQQAQLLHERAKLAEGLGSSTQQRAYEKQALAAEKRVAALREDARKKSESLPTY